MLCKGQPLQHPSLYSLTNQSPIFTLTRFLIPTLSFFSCLPMLFTFLFFFLYFIPLSLSLSTLSYVPHPHLPLCLCSPLSLSLFSLFLLPSLQSHRRINVPCDFVFLILCFTQNQYCNLQGCQNIQIQMASAQAKARRARALPVVVGANSRGVLA